MIDVAHYGDYGRARNFHVVGVGRHQFFKFFLGNHLFERHERHVIAESLPEFSHDFIVQGLVNGCEYAPLQEQGNDLFRFDSHLFREFFDRRSFDQTHGLQLAGDARSVESPGDSLLKGERRRWRNEITIEAAALALAAAFAAARGSAPRSATPGIRRRNVSRLRRRRFARRAGVFDAGSG